MTNPRYFVTGASGQLGQLVVAALANRVGADAVAAIVRDPARSASLFPEGVTIRRGDYDKPETLQAALAGAKRLLLISSNEVGRRVPQHRNVIEAAKKARVSRIAYTSVLHADTSKLGLAEEHRQTEALVEASGLSYTLLRNGWYTENYAASIAPALQHGAFIGSARDGRIASAARLDYAEAAAIALIGDEGDRVVHELAGDTSYSLSEFAAEISRQADKTIPYVDLPETDYRAALVGAGLPEPLAALYADSDAAAAEGALFDDSGALSRLIGRLTTPFAATIAATLETLGVPTDPEKPTIAASRPEDILPDDTDRTDFGGVTIRKGTIAAFLQNAMRWSDPGTSDAERKLLEDAIVEAMPALRAVGLFDVLDARDEQLRALLANI